MIDGYESNEIAEITLILACLCKGLFLSPRRLFCMCMRSFNVMPSRQSFPELPKIFLKFVILFEFHWRKTTKRNEKGKKEGMQRNLFWVRNGRLSSATLTGREGSDDTVG